MIAHSPKGIDGWVSSDAHAKSEIASCPNEQRAVYASWAATYEREMIENDLSSYKSVSSVACGLISSDAHKYAASHEPCLSVLDAGCGTGLLGQRLASEAGREFPHLQLAITGADLSCDMLAIAREKDCYKHLCQVDLNDEHPSLVDEKKFDLVVSAGLFLPGHCGPEALGFLVGTLSSGGHAVCTIREGLYAERRENFLAAAQKAGGSIVSDHIWPYYGEIRANVLVVRQH